MSTENPKYVSLESSEAKDIVRAAVQGALTKIEGVENIFKEETTEDPFTKNYDVWSEFREEVFRICRENNLPNPFSISVDSENHKVLGVVFLATNAAEIMIPYSE